MHEASVALSVLDIVIGQCRQAGYGEIEVVRLMIGKGAGILPDALLFAFDIAKRGTIASEAELVIETVAVGGVCRACQRQFETETAGFVFACPFCSSPSIQIDRGYEMQVVDMEVN
ncbi:MAG: hypothetical protein A2521_08245 [Deltaproteobacteria bacterium RIFOXYD12_FULL_57_12]|nr:MAG: hypothetical protein A2521_08245 [Deltaproteobacteria bacterium RIFOXYD12_FULL_57_12]